MTNSLILNIDNSFILLCILITLIVISLRIAYKSVGKWKAMISISGILIGILSAIIIDLIRSNITTYSSILVISIYTICSIMIIVSLIMFIMGWIYLFSQEKDK